MPNDTTQPAPAAQPFDLVLTRLIDAPAAKLYRCWTDAALDPPVVRAQALERGPRRS